MKTKQIWKLMVQTLMLGVFLGQQAKAFYDPSVGRWLSRDPMQEKGNSSLFSHDGPYCFVGNSPVQSIDQLGLLTVTGGAVSYDCAGWSGYWRITTDQPNGVYILVSKITETEARMPCCVYGPPYPRREVTYEATAIKEDGNHIVVDQDSQPVLKDTYGDVRDVFGELRLFVATPEKAGEVLQGNKDGDMWVFDKPPSFWDSQNVGTATRHSWVDPWNCCNGAVKSVYHHDP